jgi:glycosyltransferase involved in cell wall biosynthesis
MKIILVTHSFYPGSIGGREKCIFTLANALSKRHEVEVFTCSDSFSKSFKKTINSKFFIRYFPTIRIPVAGTYYRIPYTMFFELIKSNADIIHTSDFHHFTTFISALAAKKSKKPFFLIEHEYPRETGITKLFIDFYNKFFVPTISKSTDVAVAISNSTKKELINIYKIQAKKIHVIPDMINLNEYNSKSVEFRKKYKLENKKIILAVGRLVRKKGFQYLIKAFPKILENFPEAVLVIIGPWHNYKNELVSLVKKMKLKDKIIFTGIVSDKMLKSAIYCSDVFVIPSLHEGFGIVALEAMAYSKPIVASNAGGLSEILEHNKNSLLVPPGDINKLADEIMKLLKDQKLAKNIAENARREVEKYDSRKNIDKLIKIYNECI